MVNALSFDVEDFFHGDAFFNVRCCKSFNMKQRIVENTNAILSALGTRGIKATFFVLGVIAEQYPALLRTIQADGHEIGSHGYDHTPIYRHTPAQFEHDITKAKRVTERVTQEEIKGYRAPSFSVRKDTLWALEIVRSVGFQYDSSVFPIYHDRYGIPNSFDTAYEIIPGLMEFPLGTCKLFHDLRIPFGGGGYFRLYPYFVTIFLKYINKLRGSPNIFYFHPHDFDSSQPLHKLRLSSRWRRQIGLRGNKRKFIRLVSNYEFIPISQMLDEYTQANKNK
jgi:polysaccharide deacetylase family protein (PEP-CTERM system associated)